MKLAEKIYTFGERLKATIDFVVKSTLYIYTGWVGILFLLSSNEAKLEFAEIWSETSAHLLPLTTFAALFWILIVILPVFPTVMNSKTGKVLVFLLIFALVSYVFTKAILTIV